MLLPISLKEMRCIPENMFCELYVVKFGNEQEWCETLLVVTQFLELGMLLGFCIPFLVGLYLQYCMLEDSSTKCEMGDMYKYARVCMVKLLLAEIV